MGKILKRAQTIRKYHRQGCSNITCCPKNAILISKHNTLEHEIAKLIICYQIKQEGNEFITEAVQNTGGDRIDIVNITTGEEIEVDFKHGNVAELIEKFRTIYKVEKIH